MSWSKEKRRTYRREYMRAWRDANREHVRESGRRSAKKNYAALAEKRALPENRAKNRAATAAYRERLGFRGRKDRRLRKLYGITLADWEQRIEAQGGLCPICLRVLDGNHPHLDHNHTTKQNRDILCGCCNQAVGLLKESVASAERVALYLRKHGKK